MHVFFVCVCGSPSTKQSRRQEISVSDLSLHGENRSFEKMVKEEREVEAREEEREEEKGSSCFTWLPYLQICFVSELA